MQTPESSVVFIEMQRKTLFGFWGFFEAAAVWTPAGRLGGTEHGEPGFAGSHPFHVPFSTGALPPWRWEKHTAQRHRSAQLNNTGSDLEPVKCEQTDDKTATDGSTEERRAAHSTQLATCCRVTPMGHGVLA